MKLSFQSVSKWERGETLPDTAILPALAEVLGTTIDHILTGGEAAVCYRGKVSVGQMIEGLNALRTMGEKLGRDHLLYRAAIEGINEKMNTDIEPVFSDEYVFECYVAEAVIQDLMAGKYVDPTDVRSSFQQEHFRDIVLGWCEKCGIR